jgi:SAM-dependent methyltransferase
MPRVGCAGVTRDQRRLAALWQWIRPQLPPAPASVLEIGCGSLGGFVPALRGAGYQAIGIDPGAPEGPDYRRTTFEQCRPSRPAEAVVACTSLHHVTDLDTTLDGISKALAPDGVLVVVEWAWERLDEPTLQWCFARLARDPEEPSWLHTQRDECRAAGQPWAAFQQQWADQEHMHLSETILRRLADHFEPSLQRRGPYLFHDLDTPLKPTNRPPSTPASFKPPALTSSASDRDVHALACRA